MSTLTRVQKQARRFGSDRKPVVQRHHDHPVLRLQRVVGNHAIVRLHNQGLLQTRLTVNAPGDLYEQEADHVAAHIVAHLVSPEGSAGETVTGGAQQVQRQEIPEEEELLQMRPMETVPALQRQEEEEEEQEEEEELLQPRRPGPIPAVAIQRQDIPEEEELMLRRAEPISATQGQIGHEKGALAAPRAVEAELTGERGGGQALDPALRGAFESEFDRDFSGVRVHAGPDADRLARHLAADAFTTASDIYFRAGRYRPESAEGRFLLAHELTHVVQQGAAPDLDADSD